MSTVYPIIIDPNGFTGFKIRVVLKSVDQKNKQTKLLLLYNTKTFSRMF